MAEQRRSFSEAGAKIAAVEALLADAWVRLLAARDVVLLSESNGEDLFTWDEKDGLGCLMDDAARLLDRMRSRNGGSNG